MRHISPNIEVGWRTLKKKVTKFDGLMKALGGADSPLTCCLGEFGHCWALEDLVDGFETVSLVVGWGLTNPQWYRIWK